MAEFDEQDLTSVLEQEEPDEGIRGDLISAIQETNAKSNVEEALELARELDPDDKEDTQQAAESAADEDPDKQDDEPSEDGAGSEKAAAASEDDSSDKESEDAEDEGEEDEEPAGQPSLEPPASMTPAEKEAFTTYPVEAQEYLVRREKEWQAQSTRVSQEAAEHRKASEAWQQVVEPYKTYIASLGANPQGAFNVLIGMEYQLRTGSQDQKQQVLSTLARQYGIDLVSVSDQLNEDGAQIDPAIRPYVERVQRLELERAQERQLAEQQAQAAAEENSTQVQTAIEVFAEEKDDKGNLRHPHFEQVRIPMGVLMTSDPNMDMQAAYESAVWSVPTLRESLLAQQAKTTNGATDPEAEKKAKAGKAGRAKEARIKGTQIKSSATPPGEAEEPEKTLNETLTEEYNRAQAS